MQTRYPRSLPNRQPLSTYRLGSGLCAPLLALGLFFVAEAVCVQPFTSEDRSRLEICELLREESSLLAAPHEGIPHQLHLICLGSEQVSSEQLEWLRVWKKLHPRWGVHLWADQLREAPLSGIVLHTEEEFPLEEWRELYYTETDRHERAPLLSWLVLAAQGGLVVTEGALPFGTLQSACEGADLALWYTTAEQATTSSRLLPSLHLLGAAPHHPVVVAALCLAAERAPLFRKLFSYKTAAHARARSEHTYAEALYEALLAAAGRDSRRDRVMPLHGAPLRLTGSPWESATPRESEQLALCLHQLRSEARWHRAWLALACLLQVGGVVQWIFSRRRRVACREPGL